MVVISEGAAREQDAAVHEVSKVVRRSIAPDHTAVDLGKRAAAGQGHRHFEFGAQQSEHVSDPGRAAHRKTMDARLPDQHRTGAERERLEYIGAAADSAIEQNRDAAGDGGRHARQRIDGGRQRIERAPAVIGHDHRRRAMVDRSLRVSRSLFRLRPDYLVNVVGDSMRDEGILDGDLVAVHATPVARHGQVVAARVAGDRFTIKRLYWKGDVIRLMPNSPGFQPIDPDPTEDFAIEGLFAGLLRGS